MHKWLYVTILKFFLSPYRSRIQPSYTSAGGFKSAPVFKEIEKGLQAVSNRNI